MIEFDGMSRPEITKILSISTEKNINPNNDTRIYWAKEVTFDYSTTAAGRVDFMRFKPVNNSVSGIEKGDFYCFEVKSSVNDFHSKNGHNFLGSQGRNTVQCRRICSEMQKPFRRLVRSEIC